MADITVLNNVQRLSAMEYEGGFLRGFVLGDVALKITSLYYTTYCS